MPAFAMVLWPFLKGFLILIVRPFLDPANWIGLAVAGTILFGYAWIKGDHHGDRQCDVRIQRDKDEQNRKIKEEGETTFINLDRWLTEKDKGNELDKTLGGEAGKDPNAKRACLGLDGMRRLNRIKGAVRR